MTNFGKMRLLVLAVLFWCSNQVSAQVVLPWTEDFESATAASHTTDQTPIPGLSGTGYSWDLDLGTGGRGRTNAGAGFYHGGNRAITLDRNPSGSIATNYLIANIDLSTYAAASDLELSFWYTHHGEENHANDRVWMRGSNTGTWVEVYNLYANRPSNGQYTQVFLDIDDLMTTAGQAITSTFQIRFGQQDNFPASSPTASDGFSFDDLMITGTNPLPDNAGITAMISPAQGAVPGNYAVEVTMRNFGTNDLDSAMIEWEYNGTPQTPFNYTGPTVASSTNTNVVISPSLAIAAGSHTFKFWTSMPNGVADTDNTNDTLNASFCTGLGGTYTVGTPTSDYPTFAAALADLYACGVGAPVTMEVAAGTYTTPLVIDQPIPGISAANRVTWDGTNQTANINVTSGAAVALDGADYITIQNFTINNTATTQAWGVWLSNQADWNQILNNTIQMATTTSTSTAGVVATASATSATSSGNNANYTLIQGNTISGASRGVSLRGTFNVASYNNGNQVRDNDISGVDDFGVYSYYQDSVVIEGNFVHDITTVTHYGIYAFYSMNYDIIGNDVRTEDYGIYLNRSNSETAPDRRGLVANNMVQTVNDRGIYMVFTRSTDFYHNTVVSAASAVVWSNFDNTVDVKNNIFGSSSLTNFAFESFSASTFLDMDYNVFFKNPSNPTLIDFAGATYATLAAWQAAPNGYDQNSLEGEPTFNSATDLHVSGVFLNDKGITTYVTTDIDGDARPAPLGASVDIGADEYTPPANDAGVIALASPTLPITGGFNPVTVTIRNFGISPLASVNIEWEINGVAQVAVPYAGAPIATGATVDVQLANINFPVNTTGLRFWTTAPNGAVDEDFSNDTLEIDLCPGLSGTYTVGHSTSDFPTAAEAVTALQTCGVSGPVTMLFEPGTYTGPWVIGEIPGASAANTVTLDGVDAASRTVTHNGFGAGTHGTVILNGADYVTIKNFTISNTGILGAAYGVLLTNSANWNVIENNMISVVASATATNRVGILSSASLNTSTGTDTEGDNANWNIIRNNDISGGEANIILNGGDVNVRNMGNQVIGNNLHDAKDYGVFAHEQDSLAINENKIYDLLTVSGDGMELQDAENFTVLANEVTATGRGLDIKGTFSFFTPDVTANGVIANNMVSSGAEALALVDAATMFVYHNTLQGAPAFLLDNHGNIDVRNNIMSSTTICFQSVDATSMAALDYNFYYPVGSASVVRYGTTTYPTLANWQAAAIGGYGANSITGNPNFVNGLHLGSTLGVDVASTAIIVPVTVDFDGDMRPLGAGPDMGADERSVVANDATVVGLVSPSGCGDVSQDVIVSIANIGTNDLLSSPVVVNVTGPANATYNATQPLLPAGTTVDLNVGTLVTSAGGQFDFEIIINASGDSNASNDTLRLSVDINPSNQVAISMTGDNIVCVGNTATVSGTVSYAPATLHWYDAPVGGNLVHVGPSFTTPALTTATTYYAEVAGCNSPRAMAVVNVDNQGIAVDLGADITVCGGSSAQITATPSISTATSYLWSDGSQGSFIEVTSTGDYIVTVTNANGCTGTDTVTATFSPEPTINNAIQNVSCGGFNDGSINLTVIGGTGPFSFAWSNSATTEDLTGVAGGFYNVTVTDNGTSGCTYVQSYEVTEPTALSANIDATSPSCNGNDGGVDITVSGGSPAYTFLWSNNETTEDLTNAPSGVNSVTITDANGCTATQSATLAAVTPIVITVDSVYDEILAIGGGIDITATGGTGNFQYTWNTGETNDDISNLTAGFYSVTVTDLTTGCQQVLSNIEVEYKLPDMVDNIDVLDAFKLYPNPTTGQVWINMSLSKSTLVQLEVMSVTGQLLESYEPREALEQNYELDLSEYPSGVYLARFVIGNEVMTTKIIVE